MVEHSTDKGSLLLVNTHNNPDVAKAAEELGKEWALTHAPEDWPSAGQPSPTPAGLEAVIVFSPMYREDETLAICRRIREDAAFAEVPLLVAISMYQMPLGNNVKRLPLADFVFIPIETSDFSSKLAGLSK